MSLERQKHNPVRVDGVRDVGVCAYSGVDQDMLHSSHASVGLAFA